jgi:hypothetical protein
MSEQVIRYNFHTPPKIECRVSLLLFCSQETKQSSILFTSSKRYNPGKRTVTKRGLRRLREEEAELFQAIFFPFWFLFRCIIIIIIIFCNTIALDFLRESPCFEDELEKYRELTGKDVVYRCKDGHFLVS